MLEVKAGEGPEFSKAVGVIDNDIVAAFLKQAEDQKPALGVFGGRAQKDFTPDFDQLHLDFLVEFSCSFEGTKDLMAKRMDGDHPWALVNSVFMLFLNLFNIAIIQNMCSREAENFCWDSHLEVTNISRVAPSLQLQKRTDEFLLAGESLQVKEVVLGFP